MHKWLELISSKGGCITYGRVLLDTLRHFLNYEKIITARMHARGNDDVDNKTSDEMNRKNGEQDKWRNHSYLSTSTTPPSLNLCEI
jgi:hypothetical protein